MLGFPIVIAAKVSPEPPYRIETSSVNAYQVSDIYSIELNFWGNPSDPAHDVERRGGFTGPEKAFLRLPTSCPGDDLVFDFAIDSWENPGNWVTETPISPATDDCSTLDFAPDVTAAEPTTTKADAASGFDFHTHVDDPGLSDPDGRGQSDLKRAVVTLPEGVSINPSSADGLEACSPAQVDKETYDSDFGAGCPAASKIGTVEITTPLLPDDPVEGSIFLATQNDNPFDSLLAAYIVAKSPERGVNLVLPGKIETDEQTGRVVTSFDDNPQFPFTDLDVHFKSGPRAPLVTPSTCGIYETTTELTPWSGTDPVVETSTFTIDKAPDGGPCKAGDPSKPADSSDQAKLPFHPTLSAGTTQAKANSHTPFTLRLTRPEGNQTLSKLNLKMPPGLTAKLAGVSQCPDATLNAISKQAGTGAAEISSPSCPANSKVGVATVGAGSGNPLYVSTGTAYLAGPYKSAPLSLAVVVPALAGPFDLGTEVVRNQLLVDPRTAEITVVSDPLPQILHGIPLRLRDIRVRVDRESFMRTGTNCDPLQITSQITGSGGASATPANHFQLSGCGELGFSPKLKLSFGQSPKDTKANAHPELNAKLAFNEDDSNIKSVEVALPQGILLDQERLGRICSRANYAAQTCPEESKVGYAKATTPLLEDPVEGPVYLKASDNPLPDLAADLDGQIDVDLFGKIDQKLNKKGLNQIRNTFDVVPDVPVSDFELTLEGGSEGLLVNSRNICKSKSAQKLSIEISAHNGYSLSEKPLIGSACQKINAKQAKKLQKQAAKLLKKAQKTKNKRKAKKLRKQARKLKKQIRKLGR